MTQRSTRAQRLAMPLARDVVRDLAVKHGGCVRPVQLRRTDLHTGQTEPVLVPCGHTLAAVCPSCAERARALRAAQCREGWHLDHEPVVQADEPDDEQRMWVEMRSDAQRDTRPRRDGRAGHGRGLDELIGELDEEITRSGMRGNVLPARPRPPSPVHPAPSGCPGPAPPQGHPANGRQDLHRPDGKTFRPSMFLTLTCPATGASAATAPPPTRPPTTTRGRPGTRCTSPRCSTGSSRTCAASSATTSSTSPPSNRNGASPRTSTSPCAAPCPAPNCARCSPPPITRSGGHAPTR